MKFKFNVTVDAFNGSDGRVSEVLLSDGSSLPAEVVVAGIGELSRILLISVSDYIRLLLTVNVFAILIFSSCIYVCAIL